METGSPLSLRTYRVSHERPVFVVGYQRSGTTLVREAVSAHPDFCIPPESSFLTWLYPEFLDWAQSDCASSRTKAFTDALLRSKKFWLWELENSLVEDQIARERPSNYAELVGAVYRAYCRKVGKPSAQWGDKNNVHGLHLTTIYQCFPAARIIWVVRNPKDVWASMKDLRGIDADIAARDIAPRIPSSVEEFAVQWSTYQSAVGESLMSQPVSSNVLIVKYEEFVSHEDSALAQLFDFLGVESWVKGYRRRTNSQLGPEASLAWKAGVTESPNTRSVGRFHRDLSDVESQVIEKLTGAASHWAFHGTRIPPDRRTGKVKHVESDSEQ